VKPTGNYRRKNILHIAAFVAVVILGAVILSANRSVFSMIVYGIIVLGSLFLLVSGHARTFAYRCVECGHVSEISVWKDLVSPHGVDKEGGWKYLRCPSCGRRRKARIIPKEPVREI